MNVQAHSLGSSPAENKEGELWRHIKMNSVEHGIYRSIIMTGRGRIVGKSREVSSSDNNFSEMESIMEKTKIELQLIKLSEIQSQEVS